ncbi:MAG: hypothetical protein ACRD4U_11360, partial [Candidatus Acidiferrales bacterium]
PQHLMNIKRVAWESRPAETLPQRLAPEAIAARPPAPVAKPPTSAAPHPSAIADVGPSTQQPARSGAGRAWTPTAATPTGPIATPGRAVIAKVVERFLSQKGVPKGEATSANPAPAPHPSASGSDDGSSQSAERMGAGPKPADFVSESDVRAALGRSERIYISPRTIITPAARDLGNDNAVFVETDAPTAPARRD